MPTDGVCLTACPDFRMCCTFLAGRQGDVLGCSGQTDMTGAVPEGLRAGTGDSQAGMQGSGSRQTNLCITSCPYKIIKCSLSLAPESVLVIMKRQQNLIICCPFSHTCQGFCMEIYIAEKVVLIQKYSLIL